MLLQICEYIRREGMVSNQQLARAFHLDTNCLQPMLDRWLEKGVIAKASQPDGCKSKCFQCRNPPEYYSFVNASQR